MLAHALPLSAPSARFDPGLGSRRGGAGRLVLIAAVHGGLAWLLMQADVVQVALRQVSPLMVALVSEAPPAPPVPPLPLPQPRTTLTRAPALPPPEITVANAPPAPIAAPVAITVAPLAPAPAPVVVDAPPQRTVAPPVSPPAAPKQLPPGAIRYRVPPSIEVPMASRRLGESGTVLLRVHVDTQGLPKQITVHRSSGFARLDEQALAAMRAARFQPVSEGGTAIEWLVIAPLQYDID